MVLYALYKKHHWLVAGPTFYQLHLLFDKHAAEQLELVDLIAERVQSLGGIAVGDPRHAAELTTDPATARRRRGGRGHDRPHAQGARDGHRQGAARRSRPPRRARTGASNDLLMSDVLRRHELQVWFLAEHVVDVPLVTS